MPLRVSLELPGPRPWIMAHRGASEHAPENSVAAFALALEHGADLIETDLWFLADGGIACLHDRSLRRTADVDVDVTTLTGPGLSRHRLVDPAGGDHRVPLLEDLLAVVPATTPVVLELKDPRFADAERLRRLLAILGVRALQHRAAVISFDARVLAAVRAAAPGLVTGHISTRDPLGDRACDLLGPWWPLLYANPWYVRRAHARGQRVCPLDPYLHRHLPRWLAMDVDAVLTNDPRATRAEIERLRARR
jgi:glycerophosphoryl diester phosphodiesterase